MEDQRPVMRVYQVGFGEASDWRTQVGCGMGRGSRQLANGNWPRLGYASCVVSVFPELLVVEAPMSDQADRYYRPSGKIPFVGTAAMLLVGTLVALLVSFVYALISRYNPLIYIQFFVTLVFGIVLGVSVNMIGHSCKVRNRFFMTLIAMVIGCLGLYFAWVWYIYMVLDWDRDVLVFDPAVTFNVMQLFGQIGLWEMKGAKPTGWALYSFWIIEALIVLWMCYSTGSSMETPFCEFCNCWTEKKGAIPLVADDPVALQEALEEEDYDIIPKLASAEIAPSDFYLAQCWACPKCQESGYLNVSKVTIVQGKEGPETRSLVFIPAIAVPHSVIEEVDDLVVNKVAKAAETSVVPDTPATDEAGETTAGE